MVTVGKGTATRPCPRERRDWRATSNYPIVGVRYRLGGAGECRKPVRIARPPLLRIVRFGHLLLHLGCCVLYGPVACRPRPSRPVVDGRRAFTLVWRYRITRRTFRAFDSSQQQLSKLFLHYYHFVQVVPRERARRTGTAETRESAARGSCDRNGDRWVGEWRGRVRESKRVRIASRTAECETLRGRAMGKGRERKKWMEKTNGINIFVARRHGYQPKRRRPPLCIGGACVLPSANDGHRSARDGERAKNHGHVLPVSVPHSHPREPPPNATGNNANVDRRGRFQWCGQGFDLFLLKFKNLFLWE